MARRAASTSSWDTSMDILLMDVLWARARTLSQHTASPVNSLTLASLACEHGISHAALLLAGRIPSCCGPPQAQSTLAHTAHIHTNHVQLSHTSRSGYSQLPLPALPP